MGERVIRVGLPILAIGLFLAFALSIAASAGSLLGYDYEAYLAAARRLVAGAPLYDPAVDVAGGFAIYLYPPPFALAMVPFTLLPAAAGPWAWTLLLCGAVIAAVALMPVAPSIRWLVLILAAIDWPVLFSIKLGQVGPLLLLAITFGWRWLDRPAVLGLSIAAGAITKLQPLALIGWAILTRRLTAAGVALGAVAVAVLVSTVVAGPSSWLDYAALLARVSDPITTPHNFTPGAVAHLGGLDAAASAAVQFAVVVLTVAVALLAIYRSAAEASYLAVVLATQLVSPLLWDHYAILLLLPVAFLLERRQWWAVVLPLLTSLPLLGLVPVAIYPLEFLVAQLATAWVGRNRTTAAQPMAMPA
jgi:alpha-1,2-mannosyltransferase